MFEKSKAKLKAIQLAPQIMAKVPTHAEKKKEVLKSELVESYKTAKTLQDKDQLDDDKQDELYIEQSALAMAYFQKDRRPPNPHEVSAFMNECAQEAGIKIEE